MSRDPLREAFQRLPLLGAGTADQQTFPKWPVISAVAVLSVVACGGVVALRGSRSAPAGPSRQTLQARQAPHLPAGASLGMSGGQNVVRSSREAPTPETYSSAIPVRSGPAAAPVVTAATTRATVDAKAVRAAAHLWKEGFSPVNGGGGQSCHAPAGEWESPCRINHRVGSLQQCRELCKGSSACAGVGYISESGVCEVWTTPISGSTAKEGHQCFRYEPAGFWPVPKGVGQACEAAKNTIAIGGKHYNEHKVRSLYECKIRCHMNHECLGIDYDFFSHKCQIWRRPVAGSRSGKHHLCMRRDPLGFKSQGMGLFHECALGKDDDDTLKHSKVHLGVPSALVRYFDRSLYECKARCAHGGTKCKGISYSEDTNSCEMWTLPINASEKVKKKSTCLTFEPPHEDSLYCVTLMMPWTDEPVLLEAQLKHRLGIFACDGFAIFSNPVAKVGHLETKLIDMDLHAPSGGEYNTSLNTPMFIKLWELIVAEGRYAKHDWVVKTDPDTVFFPERLRWIVSELHAISASAKSGVWLSNCQLGMHGPTEVFSIRALEVYDAGKAGCWQAEQEDVYMENCLRQLGADEVRQFDTIAERDCWRGEWHQYPDWQRCETPHASFHPFKTIRDYQDCWGRAVKAANWPPARLHDRVE